MIMSILIGGISSNTSGVVGNLSHLENSSHLHIVIM